MPTVAEEFAQMGTTLISTFLYGLAKEEPEEFGPMLEQATEAKVLIQSVTQLGLVMGMRMGLERPEEARRLTEGVSEETLSKFLERCSDGEA